jgi:hypothetical protein
MQPIIADEHDKMIVQCGYEAASQYIRCRNPCGVQHHIITCDSSTDFNVTVQTLLGLVSRDDHPLIFARQCEAFRLILEHVRLDGNVVDTTRLRSLRFAVANTYRHLRTRVYEHGLKKTRNIGLDIARLTDAFASSGEYVHRCAGAEHCPDISGNSAVMAYPYEVDGDVRYRVSVKLPEDESPVPVNGLIDIVHEPGHIFASPATLRRQLTLLMGTMFLTWSPSDTQANLREADAVHDRMLASYRNLCMHITGRSVTTIKNNIMDPSRC